MPVQSVYRELELTAKDGPPHKEYNAVLHPVRRHHGIMERHHRPGLLSVERSARARRGTCRVPRSSACAAINAACERAGHHDYERLRWRAMLLLMRFYGLRVSDVATLERKRVNEQRIAVRAIKNKRWLWMPLYPEVGAALEAVPPPYGLENKYFFWTEHGSRENHVNNTIMSLAAVYRASGVPAATSHRFRHTLAMELLAKGASVEQVADVLGDSPATVRKHYKHWMPEYQAATAELLDRVHRTAKQSR